MTNQERVVALVAATSGLSAYEIATVLKLDPATVASFLKKMVDKGSMRRVPDTGPRGGYTYYAQ